MSEDDKLSSNFVQSQPAMSFAAPNTVIPLPPPPGDDTFEAGMAGTPNATVNGTPVIAVPTEPPKDFTALAKMKIYEAVSKNGAASEMNVSVNMVDDKEGSGQADVIVGKDIYKRTFEIPIMIKGGKVEIGKAIDKDTDERVDVSKIFDKPSEKVVDERLTKLIEKHMDVFKGKPNEHKIKLLMARFPSMDTAKATAFLSAYYDENKLRIFKAMDKVTDGADMKMVALVAGIIATVVVIALVKHKKTEAAFSAML